MSNHLHLLASVVNANPGLPDIMRDFKKFTSKKIIETIELINESRKDWLLDKFEFAGRYNPKIKDYKVWQDGYHPVACFSKEFTKQKLDYIHNNPVKAGLVWEPQHYALSSAVDYYEGRKGKVNVLLLE
jgi:REP element-mobilizing transposase RayT